MAITFQILISAQVLIYFAALEIYAIEKSDEDKRVIAESLQDAILVVIYFASFVVAVYLILLDVFGYTGLDYAYRTVTKRLSKTLGLSSKDPSWFLTSSKTLDDSSGTTITSSEAKSDHDDDQDDDDDVWPSHVDIADDDRISSLVIATDVNRLSTSFP